MRTDTTRKTGGITSRASAKKRVATVPRSSPKDLALRAQRAATASKSTPPAGARASGPLALPLRLIEEDPQQPRTEDNPGFSPQSIAELAATIQLRGVKSPISVRDNPGRPGHYLINHGARRLRASKLAGNTTIPAFVDNDYNEVDQVIENLQRNQLTAREIADYLGRELAKGIRQGEIAKSIGKSKAFVTQHIALLDLPEPIAQAFNAGRAKDVTVVNELVTAMKKNPQEVTEWLEDNRTQDITRSAVKLLRQFLEEKRYQATVLSDEGPEDSTNALGVHDEDAEAHTQPAKPGRAVLQVRYHRRTAQLLWYRRPVEEGFAWIKYEDTGEEVKAPLAEVKLIALR